MSEDSHSNFTANDRASAEAMEWVVRKDRGLNEKESRAFAAWLAEKTIHREEFGRALDFWRRMDQLPQVANLAEEADAIIGRARKRRRFRRRIGLSLGGLAAAVAIAISLFGYRFPSPVGPARIAASPKEAFEVLKSTARQMKLSDGTVVELNGDSRIEVEFTAEERRVRLVAGEAQFFVAKDTHHPFLVVAQTVTVRAVGTAFNVRLNSSSVEVLVTEGKILLNGPHSADPSHPASESGPSVAAGQFAVVSTNPSAAATPVTVGSAGPLEIDQVLAWQSTRLVFDRTPLEGVIAAFNRYNDRHLVLGSPELRSRTLSGVFRADNVDGFVRLLQVSVDVRAEKKSDSETVLYPSR